MAMERRIVRRFGSTKPAVQEADPEDEPQETQDDEEEETQPLVRRRVLSQPTLPAKVVVRQPVAPPPAARVIARQGTLLVEDEPEEDKIILKAGRRPVPPAIRPEPEDDDLEEDPKPVARAVRKAVVVEEPEDAVGEPEEEDLKEDPKPVVKPQPFPEPALEKFRIRSVNETVAGDVFNQMFEAMAAGTSIIITKLEENKWQFTSTNIQAAAVEKSTGLKLGNGKAYFAEVLNPAYLKFYDEWNNLTYDERKRRAKKAGTTWKEDKNPKMDAMRMTEAYLEKLGIKKYKPEYMDFKKRAAIRG